MGGINIMCKWQHFDGRSSQPARTQDNKVMGKGRLTSGVQRDLVVCTQVLRFQMSRTVLASTSYLRRPRSGRRFRAGVERRGRNFSCKLNYS